MVALQMGTSTLSGCDTKSLGGVTTKLPQRGHVLPGRGVDRVGLYVRGGDVAGLEGEVDAPLRLAAAGR